MATIGDNLQAVYARVSRAATAAGRDPASIRVVAVSKAHAAAHVEEAIGAGQRAFGENYVQEALEKMDLLRARAASAAPLEWHLIGPLQANKTRLVAERFDWVHTIEREKIARRLAEQRPARLAPLEVLIQVNISGEASKSGVAPRELAALARAVAALPRLRLRGLMALPAPGTSAAAQRAAFRAVRELLDALRADPGVAGGALDTLSMGMSEDLEAAIAEGATLVRVGTAIFGARRALGSAA
jgi:hypothetical protein